MRLNIASDFAKPTIKSCNLLIDEIKGLKKTITPNTLWELGQYTEQINVIYSSIRHFEEISHNKFTAKPDPYDLIYHDKLGEIFRKFAPNSADDLLEILKKDCLKKMRDHLTSQLKAVIEEVIPYYILDSDLDYQTTENENNALQETVPCTFKETAAKCRAFAERLIPVKKGEELRALNTDFQKILSDIAQFRKTHEITFRTNLEHRDILYYDKLLSVYLSTAIPNYFTVQDLIKEEFSIRSIKLHLLSELEGVTKLCNKYQPQLEFDVDDPSQDPTQFLLS